MFFKGSLRHVHASSARRLMLQLPGHDDYAPILAISLDLQTGH